MFFPKEYADWRKHQTMEAKQAGYSSANTMKEKQVEEMQEKMTEEYAALTQELIQQMNDKTEAKYETMLKQMHQLLEQNTKLMEALLTMQQKGAQAGTGQQGSRKKHRCKHCKKMVMHEDKDCYELEENASK